MRIVSAEYVISAVGPKQYPEGGQPEIAFAGRSNVGKSSLINRLVNRKALARTSGSPGKTRLLNFYHINDSFYFVDLPGYGFAKVSRVEKAAWGKMIEEYLLNRDNLRVVIQLIDIRHAPSREDVQMYEWLKHFGIPTILVTTKADKIARGNWPKHIRVIKETLIPYPATPVIAFSAETGQGKDELWKLIGEKMI
ncbi:ribosome biogenesis GTP-binding protein YihA/YsxC [Phosphitispora fastidiosa]|uniref:ribosome biogenesis GTP-binding protein YihA/YsxC n=1 Tax=Phosphitispora fastidiosa TaxID=2837202 RepID=UPI001E36C452|nr:ribosome biogenesis GTP-binding protein YihA/YsxC [Phosphitispora fastidiosa]MBU7006423.1 GTP-binding protein [Phosphitispora fastidiosa]